MSMPQNPYESPLIAAPAEPSAPDPRGRRRRGLFAMAFMGFFVGSITAGPCGTIGAATLGLAFDVLQPQSAFSQDEEGRLPGQGDWSLYILLGGVLGCGCGIASGGCLGAVLGFVAGLSRPEFRRPFVMGTVGISALIGGGFGLLGSLFLSEQILSTRDAFIAMRAHCAWYGIGAMIGAVAGAVGGFVLGRALAHLCWGPAAVSRT